MLVFITFQSCASYYDYNNIRSANDIVYNTKRFELKYYVQNKDYRSPVTSLTQDIIKEIDLENEVSYTAYDVLQLSSSGFKLDEKVFFLIENVAYPMILDKVELETVKNTTENKSDISTSDSTTVSVVTGYSENNIKNARFSYKIPVDIMEKIKDSKQLLIRYYSGPSMITFKPSSESISKIRELFYSE